MQEQSKSYFSERQKTLSPYDLLYGQIDLKKEIGNHGLRLLIPVSYLHPRQFPQEYSRKKRKQIETVLQAQGLNYLLENPAIVCALFENNNSSLAIIDGHHRARYSSLYGIREIPSLIITPAILSSILNKYNAQQTTSKELAEKLTHEIGLALGELSRHSHFKPPIPILEATNLEGLRKKFPSF